MLRTLKEGAKLAFGENVSSEPLRLFAVDESQIERLQNGETYVKYKTKTSALSRNRRPSSLVCFVCSILLKATENQDTVVCTNDSTYRMQFVETSNSVLLIPPRTAGHTEDEKPIVHIEGISKGTFEVSLCPSRAYQVRELLERSFLDNPDEDPDPSASTLWEADPSVNMDVRAQWKEGEDLAGRRETSFLMDDVSSSTPAKVSRTGKARTPASASPIPRDVSGRPITIHDAKDSTTENAALGRQRLFTQSDLRRVVQASDEELLDELDRLGAVRVGAFWRLLTPSYERDIVDHVLQTIVENRWSLLSLPKDECIGLLGDRVPRKLTAHILKRLGERPTSTESHIALSVIRIARARGIELLRLIDTSLGAGQPLDEFLRTWTLSLDPLLSLDGPKKLSEVAPASSSAPAESSDPDYDLVTFTPSLQLLAGHLLVESKGDAEVVTPFFENSLPTDPELRFQDLFKRRERWTIEDLEPYIEPLVGPGRLKADLLLAHTRTTLLPDGSRIYSKR